MKTRQSKVITCPSCLHQFTADNSGKNQLMMAHLVDRGFGLREVGRIFNEHPETVKYWHKKLKEQLATPTSKEQ